MAITIPVIIQKLKFMVVTGQQVVSFVKSTVCKRLHLKCKLATTVSFLLYQGDSKHVARLHL